MEPYEGEGWRRWHRDRPHWQQHPLRTQYIHALVYLADVDETTHCFSLSPEAADAPILDQEDQARPRRYRRSARPGRHRGALQPLSATRGDHPPDAARTQNRPNLLRTPRPTSFEQLHDPARSALARPFRPRSPRLLLSTQSQVASLCRGFWRICTRLTTLGFVHHRANLWVVQMRGVVALVAGHRYGPFVAQMHGQAPARCIRDIGDGDGLVFSGQRLRPHGDPARPISADHIEGTNLSHRRVWPCGSRRVAQ